MAVIVWRHPYEAPIAHIQVDGQAAPEQYHTETLVQSAVLAQRVPEYYLLIIARRHTFFFLARMCNNDLSGINARRDGSTLKGVPQRLKLYH